MREIRQTAETDESRLVQLDSETDPPRRTGWSRLLAPFAKPERIPLPQRNLETDQDLAHTLNREERELEAF